jgi:F-type H+-transporting ATPase subunit b
LIEEAKTAALAEADKVKAQAQAEIEQEKNRAKAELRKELAALTFAGAEKVLGATIDQAAHAGLVEKLAAELH